MRPRSLALSKMSRYRDVREAHERVLITKVSLERDLHDARSWTLIGQLPFHMQPYAPSIESRGIVRTFIELPSKPPGMP